MVLADVIAVLLVRAADLGRGVLSGGIVSCGGIVSGGVAAVGFVTFRVGEVRAGRDP